MAEAIVAGNTQPISHYTIWKPFTIRPPDKSR